MIYDALENAATASNKMVCGIAPNLSNGISHGFSVIGLAEGTREKQPQQHQPSLFNIQIELAFISVKCSPCLSVS